MKTLQKKNDFGDRALLGLSTGCFQQSRIEKLQTLVDFLQRLQLVRAEGGDTTTAT